MCLYALRTAMYLTNAPGGVRSNKWFIKWVVPTKGLVSFIYVAQLQEDKFKLWIGFDSCAVFTIEEGDGPRHYFEEY